MEKIKLLVDLLVELHSKELYDAASVLGIRLKEEIYNLEAAGLAAKSEGEHKDEVQPIQPEQT